MTTSARHPLFWTAIAIGFLEVLGVAVYGIVIGVSSMSSSSQGVTGSNVSPLTLVVIFIVFAAMIGLVIRGLLRGSGAARTPYLVTQAFALVIAQALISGSETFEVILGWLLVLIGIAGAASILTPAASRGLNLDR
jgi:hypothetical protein